ncbi:hypothetical protein TRFO_12979 [Tritrichomonas foetus]|uniref:VPS9 domain-containing protein n=1 Tax=Tritrichomonas foetus TaxID=1144522 RepID=A0A1J4L0V3_9EUKA|nr:hypothetical protein TRFO_12979 [Tritrichomonas foetus]|eukprot:OHT16720.1 hypothetical protein TRFO_12979 [Tritrichomonas foetus]
MSNDESLNETSKYHSFEEWAQSNLHLIPYLMFFSESHAENLNISAVNFPISKISDKAVGNPASNITKLSTKSNEVSEKFKHDRQRAHYQIIKNLQIFEQQVILEKEKVWEMLQEWTGREIPDVDYLCYDDKKIILLMRKQAYIRQKVSKHAIQLLTKKYGKLLDLERDSKVLIKLFMSKNLLPDDQICKLDNFCIISFTGLVEKHLSRIKMYTALDLKYSSEIQKANKALWATNFPLFMNNLISDAKNHLLTELSYFEPLDGELSLSRCFFCYKSPFQIDIDNIIDQFNSTPPQIFVSMLIDECYKLVPNREKMQTMDQSICLLLFYRCLFNRCYEKYGKMICSFNYESVLKLNEISKVPAKYFPIPFNLIRTGTPEDPIGSIFEKDVHFQEAANFLDKATFQPNPIDALYQIHKTLVGINKGALFNRVGENGTASIDDVKQLLCFDDMFALLLGTLLGSNKPDLFFVSTMISNYAPKMSLSPSFEYAQANLEALTEHCLKFDMEKCLREINGEETKEENVNSS